MNPFGINIRSFPQGWRVRRKCAHVSLPFSPRTQAGRSGLVVRASEVDDELAAVSAAVEVGPPADRAPRPTRVPDAASSVIFAHASAAIAKKARKVLLLLFCAPEDCDGRLPARALTSPCPLFPHTPGTPPRE